MKLVHWTVYITGMVLVGLLTPVCYVLQWVFDAIRWVKTKGRV